MKRVVPAVRLLLSALAAALALGVVECAYAQMQQKRPQATPRHAQPATPVDDRRWQALMDQAEAEIRNGEYARGEDTGGQLVAEALKLFGDSYPDTAGSLNVIADAQMRQGNTPTRRGISARH